MDRTVSAFLVGLAAGGIGGWFGAWAGQAAFGKSGGPRPTTPRERPPVAGARGNAPPPPAGAPSAPAGPRLAGTGADLGDLEAVAARDRDAAVRGLGALARFHAIAGNETEFLQVAERALESGLPFDDLLAALEEFPAGRRGALLAMLLDRAPRAEFDVARVATLLADGGEGPRALALVREALPRGTDLDADLARLLLRLDPAGGTALLFEMGERARWDAEALGVVRALLIQAGREDRLQPFLERALEDRPADHDLLRWLRRLDPAAAEARAAALVKALPGDPWGWAFLGEIRKEAGDAKGAFEAFRRAAELDPGRRSFRGLVAADAARGLAVVEAWAAAGEDAGRVGTLAEMYALAGRKEDAVQAYLRAHGRDPKEAEWIERLTELDPGAAVAALERQIGAAPDAASDETLGRYAEALAASGRRDAAFEQYLAAHRRRPQDGGWQRGMAAADPQRALPVLEAHVRDHPSDASGHGALGLSLAAVGRRAEALEHLERAVAQGDLDRWYPSLKDLDPDRAIDGLSRRAQASPLDPDLWGQFGEELLARGDLTHGRAALEHAARLDPANRRWAEGLRDLR